MSFSRQNEGDSRNGIPFVFLMEYMAWTSSQPGRGRRLLLHDGLVSRFPAQSRRLRRGAREVRRRSLRPHGRPMSPPWRRQFPPPVPLPYRKPVRDRRTARGGRRKQSVPPSSDCRSPSQQARRRERRARGRANETRCPAWFRCRRDARRWDRMSSRPHPPGTRRECSRRRSYRRCRGFCEIRARQPQG